MKIVIALAGPQWLQGQIPCVSIGCSAPLGTRVGYWRIKGVEATFLDVSFNLL